MSQILSFQKYLNLKKIMNLNLKIYKSEKNYVYNYEMK